jgi:hypothetical protein
MIPYILPIVKDVVTTVLFTTIRGTIDGVSLVLRQVLQQENQMIAQWKQTLQALDLEQDVQCADAFLQLIEQQYPAFLQYVPLQISLQHVQMILKQIHDMLWICNDKMEQHQLKWFAKYRTLSLERECMMLQDKQRLLKKRFDWLEKTLQMCISLHSIQLQTVSTCTQAQVQTQQQIKTINHIPLPCTQENIDLDKVSDHV